MLQRAIGNRGTRRVLARQGGGGTASGTPRLSKHVVIDVNDGMADEWSKQWIAAQPQARERVAMAAGAGPAEAIATIKSAIAKAGPGGRIIFNVGHGGSLDTEDDGFVDLSPKSHGYRLGGRNVSNATVNVFYDLDPDGPGPAKADMTHDLENNPKGTRLATWRQYQDLCQAFRAGRIERVVFLTCRVGSSGRFLRKIANDWNTVITAYKDQMQLTPQSVRNKSGKDRIRMHLKRDPAGSGTNIPASEEQVPLATEANSVSVGPPLPGSGGATSMSEPADGGDSIAALDVPVNEDEAAALA